MTAPTKLSIFNGALRLLGQSRLASLTDTSEARRLLDDAWAADVVRTCLARSVWMFASRTSMLDPSPSESTSFGYANVYTKPDDWVRTISLTSDEFLENQILRIHEDGANWYSDENPVYLRYVSDDTTYGRNYALWPEYFSKYVEASFAVEIAATLTHDDKIVKYVETKQEETLRDAQNENAMNQPTRMMPQGLWSSARGGRTLRRYDRG